MRKITLLLSLAVLLLMGSCAKDEPLSIDNGEKVTVKYTAQLPGYIDSRAIGDGKKANELFFWVFDENNHELSALRQRNISFNNSGQATVEVSLTPRGQGNLNCCLTTVVKRDVALSQSAQLMVVLVEHPEEQLVGFLTVANGTAVDVAG